MAQHRLELQPAQVICRLVTRQASNVSGSTAVLGSYYLPTRSGINGQRGWFEGQYERRLNEEGPITLTFPNGAGEDGKMHRDRFAIILNGKLTPQGGNIVYASIGGAYRPGDEFLEIWRSQSGGSPGDLLAVMAITSATITPATIVLNGYDALWLQKKTRETAFGFWLGAAPRDVFEHYTRTWLALMADDFTGSVLGSAWTQTTASGGTITARALQSLVSLSSPATSGASATIKGQAFQAGANATDPHAPWRFEARVRATVPTGANTGSVTIGLQDASGNTFADFVISGSSNAVVMHVADPAGSNASPWSAWQVPIPATGWHTYAIEAHDRWLYWLIDGVLVFVCPMPPGAASTWSASVLPVFTAAGFTAGTAAADIDYAIIRQAQRFLNRQSAPVGDYQLPGAPTPGGLLASYFNLSDFYAKLSTNTSIFAPQPTMTPTAKVIEATLAANPQPSAALLGTQAWLVRYEGAVYLKLSGGNYTFTITLPSAGSGAYARLWVGKSRLGESIIGTVTAWGTGAATVTGTVNAAALGGTDGWYPICLEYLVASNAGISTGPTLAFTPPASYTDPGGTALSSGVSVTVPTTSIAPEGTWSKQVRLESHYDQLIALSKDYGLQFSCEPMSLESGEFPGRMVPKVRYGRDTEYVVRSIETASMQDDLNAEEVCDALLADAQGLADPSGAIQLSAEVFNFAQIANHLFVLQEYDQQNDVTVPALLLQRLSSLLALRGAPWEQISATPRGTRQLVDSFPLTGQAAEYASLPGDGVRLAFPELSVVDASPRQILGVQWPIRPDGIGVPQAAFRQRPRDFRRILRDMMRDQQQANRYYQGQVATVSGSVAAWNGTTAGQNPSGTPIGDQYTRVALPTDLSRVVSATLVVQYAGTGTWTVQQVIGGANVTRFSVTQAGRYDMTQWIGPESSGFQRMTVVVPSGVAGQAIQYNLELVIRI